MSLDEILAEIMQAKELLVTRTGPPNWGCGHGHLNLRIVCREELDLGASHYDRSLVRAGPSPAPRAEREQHDPDQQEVQQRLLQDPLETLGRA